MTPARAVKVVNSIIPAGSSSIFVLVALKKIASSGSPNFISEEEKKSSASFRVILSPGIDFVLMVTVTNPFSSGYSIFFTTLGRLPSRSSQFLGYFMVNAAPLDFGWPVLLKSPVLPSRMARRASFGCAWQILSDAIATTIAKNLPSTMVVVNKANILISPPPQSIDALPDPALLDHGEAAFDLRPASARRATFAPCSLWGTLTMRPWT